MPHSPRTRAPGLDAVRRPRAARAGAKAPEAAGDTTDAIVAAVIDAIVERRLMPGTKLAEQPLADRFGVSRTVVRQALNRLSRDRLVTLTPARGATVASPGLDEARQVFEVRRLLEAGMARHLATTLTPAQRMRLEAHLREERAAVARVDTRGRTRLLADFHVLLAQLAGNEVLAQILGDLLSRSQLIALMHQSAHSAAHSQHEHEAIVAALAAGDADTAARLMTEHIESVERHLAAEPGVAQAPAQPAPARRRRSGAPR